MGIIYSDWANGDDSTGVGTSGNPYKTLDKAFTVAAIGDTIRIANTAAQAPTAQIAMPGLSTTSDAWLIIEGWDNGGSLQIDNPAGNVKAVGVFDGTSLSATTLFTSPISFVKFRNLRFQNFAFSTGQLGASSNFNIFEGCDFSSNSASTGRVLSPGTSCFVKFCSFRNNNITSTGEVVFFSSATSTAFGNYFYNSKNALTFQSNAGVCQYNIFDKISGWGVTIGSNTDRFVCNNNTIIGDGSASNFGINFTNTTAEFINIFNNHFQDFSGSGSCAVRDSNVTWPTTAGSFDLVGANSFYNCATTYENAGNFTASIMTDLRSLDVTETQQPLVNPALFDYRKRQSAASYQLQSHFGGYNHTLTKSGQMTGAAQATILDTTPGTFPYRKRRFGNGKNSGT